MGFRVLEGLKYFDDCIYLNCGRVVFKGNNSY